MGWLGLVVAGDDFWPAAAKVLAALLDKLHSVSARGRRGRLAVVRTLTERGGA